MRPEVVVDEQARVIFLREIEVTAQLRHPNVVELLDHGVLDDTLLLRARVLRRRQRWRLRCSRASSRFRWTRPCA